MFNFATFNSLLFNGWASGKRLNTALKPSGGAESRNRPAGIVSSAPRPGLTEPAPSMQLPTIDVDSPDHDVDDSLIDVGGYLFANKIRRQPGVGNQKPRVGM